MRQISPCVIKNSAFPMNCTRLDELLDIEFGKISSETREEFDLLFISFAIVIIVL